MTMGERFASAHDAYADGSDTTSLPLLIHDDFLWTSFTRPTGSPAVTKQEMLQMIEDAGPDDEVTVFPRYRRNIGDWISRRLWFFTAYRSI